MKIVYVFGVVFFILFLFSLKARQEEDFLRSNGLYPPPGTGTIEHVKSLATRGYKIPAIKLYREINGVGLKEAKEAVEKLTGNRPKI